MNVNFVIKIHNHYIFLMITMAPARTIHIVALPTILSRGVGLEVCKCEEKNQKKLEITMTRFEF